MALSRPIHFVVFGQSYGRIGYEYGAAYWAFCTAIKNVIATDYATISTNTGLTVAADDVLQRRQHATDGSAIVQANQGMTGYWVANDLTTPGTLLSDATTAISGYGTAPILGVYSHGEQDAVKITTQAQAADVGTAIEDVILPEIRAAMNAGTPTNVPIWLDVLGPRYSGDELPEYWIRDAMLAIIDAGTNLFRGAEKYALQLGSDAHPTPESYRQMGAHTGRKVANWLVNSATLDGPSISTPSLSGLDVTVPISVPSGKTLVKPASPDFFGLFDGSDNAIAITGYSWSGDNLTITGASAPAKMRYPVPTGSDDVNISKIIRLSDPSDPLYTGEPGLVLESMITHTF